MEIKLCGTLNLTCRSWRGKFQYGFAFTLYYKIHRITRRTVFI